MKPPDEVVRSLIARSQTFSLISMTGMIFGAIMIFAAVVVLLDPMPREPSLTTIDWPIYLPFLAVFMTMALAGNRLASRMLRRAHRFQLQPK